MKANELMIGDWMVGCSGKPFKIGIVDLDFLHWNDIKPIPLSPEILEKNGFVKVFSEYWCMDEWKCRSIGTAWVDYENCIRMEIETNGVHITMPIHYIHELQHTLKLCGIEKTIEL